jgi:hypothetical protein
MPLEIASVLVRLNHVSRFDNLSKAGWSGAASQRLIQTGKRSSLQTRTATTESVSLHADDKPTAFLELESAIRPVTS